MVLCTAATVITGGGAAAIGAAIGSSATAAGAGTGAAVGTATGVGVSGGAITGTAATTGAVAGAVAGGSAVAGNGGNGAGLGAGLLGVLAVGFSEENHITYDCWKPVVHDKSSEPSNGMLLKEMVCHPHVSKVTVSPGTLPELPNIVVENIWNEMFEIEYFWLHDTGRIVCHAKPVCM